MIKRIVLIALFVFLCVGIQAQKEAYNWAFGYNAGLSWNTPTTPASMTGMAVYKFNFITEAFASTPTNEINSLSIPKPIKTDITTYEGCFALSDPQTGQFMVYSDGMKIHFPQNLSTVTELSGHHSSNQSGVVLPFPGSANAGKFIALSIPLLSTTTSVRYTVIDMQNGGRVVTDSNNQPIKNIPLTGHSGILGESLNVIAHKNKRDFWIVAPGHGVSGATCFNAWLVTKDGIHTSTPVKTFVNIDTGWGIGVDPTVGGAFKFSPKGDSFVWCGAGAGAAGTSLIFGDFDSATGLFSNINLWSLPGGQGSPSRAEFSQSGKYLYMTAPPSLYVFDFEALKINPGTGPLYGQRIREGNSGSYIGVGGVQMGPDGYLYLTYYYIETPATAGSSVEVTRLAGAITRHILLITNPESPGTSANKTLKIYKLYSFLLTGTGGHVGLPSFSPSWFSADITGETDICADVPRSYRLTVSRGGAATNITHTVWNFGDGRANESPNTNVSQGAIQEYSNIKYSTPGSYTITVKFYNGASEITDLRQTLTVNVSDCSIPVNPHIRGIVGK
ncbi:hypothetical protein M2459_003485 [Parabacteroides sp. PF5-5]|uniref:PKD domain-containing protein n=1 Tax=unclassified Parabacteroides TaxID=2649774 RepID=UPI0024767608|nr:MULTISPECIES: PKD domain-containing protein [unclassified Parabacteroides]MDH6306888.1 hypothetical protein [Parabacteroides sp. PH5-39]MDH6317724.1 hypothetical protein [Parabacteroides sp. PF5-13]MDH6321596.1 hypothetical protein [Parabacteroides sp. PH5-13]MDH6325275.1 hypothetical protein [Parabacteroides sp. PH5-8]MDH6328909.1 hypothetical protein [Parabacteroides sp. PH5-41]